MESSASGQAHRGPTLALSRSKKPGSNLSLVDSGSIGNGSNPSVKGAESGVKHRQIQRPFHPDVHFLRKTCSWKAQAEDQREIFGTKIEMIPVAFELIPQ